MVLGKFGVEPLDCFEILPLASVIERLAEKEVPQIVTRGPLGSESHDEIESDECARHSHRLEFSKRDRGLAGVESGHSQLHELWFHFLAERKVFGAAEIRAGLKLAINKHVELMIPRRHIPDVDPLHATLAQGLELFGAVDVMRNQLTVDLEPHSVEAHLVAFGQRDKDRDLCP